MPRKRDYPMNWLSVTTASSDKTLDIAKEFAACAPFPVRLNVNENNLGVVKNFEKAIALCEGSIIALSDQDDVWLPHKLGRLEQTMSSNGAALVFSDAHVVDDELNLTGQRLWEFTFKKADRALMASGKGVQVLLKRSVVTGATMAFSSALRKMLLPIPAMGHLIHDNWIALLVAASSKVAFIDEPLMNYRQHSNQHTGVFEPRVALAPIPEAVKGGIVAEHGGFLQHSSRAISDGHKQAGDASARSAHSKEPCLDRRRGLEAQTEGSSFYVSGRNRGIRRAARACCD